MRSPRSTGSQPVIRARNRSHRQGCLCYKGTEPGTQAGVPVLQGGPRYLSVVTATLSFSTAWAAERRAIGTRNGEQLT